MSLKSVRKATRAYEPGKRAPMPPNRAPSIEMTERTVTKRMTDVNLRCICLNARPMDAKDADPPGVELEENRGSKVEPNPNVHQRVQEDNGNRNHNPDRGR